MSRAEVHPVKPAGESGGIRRIAAPDRHDRVRRGRLKIGASLDLGIRERSPYRLRQRKPDGLGTQTALRGAILCFQADLPDPSTGDYPGRGRRGRPPFSTASNRNPLRRAEVDIYLEIIRKFDAYWFL
jgi:hypothetical protein